MLHHQTVFALLLLNLMFLLLLLEDKVQSKQFFLIPTCAILFAHKLQGYVVVYKVDFDKSVETLNLAILTIAVSSACEV